MKRINFSNNDTIAADAMYKLGEMSYKMEEARYESLLSSSSHIINCISIATIALATLFPSLIMGPEKIRPLVVVAYLTTYAVFLPAFTIALFAQYRFRYTELRSPEYLARHTKDQMEEFKTSSLAAKYFCECIEDSYQSIRARNKKISRLVKISTVLIIIAIGMIVAWVIFLYGMSL